MKAGRQLGELRPTKRAACPSLRFFICKVAIMSSFSEVNSGWRSGHGPLPGRSGIALVVVYLIGTLPLLRRPGVEAQEQ